MLEKYSWSVGCPAPDLVEICRAISSVTRNVSQDVSALTVNFLITRIAVSPRPNVLVSMKRKSFNLETVLALETAKLGTT